MNVTIMIATLRQRLTSPIRLVLLALMLVVPLGVTALMPQNGFKSLGDSFPLTLILAAGLIGQDISAGVLQLLFARPVRRSEYVLSRWFAVSAAAAALSIWQCVLAALIMALRHQPAGFREFALFAGNTTLIAFGSAAVVTLFSSLLSGFGDLALLLMCNIVGGLMQFLGQLQNSPLIARLGTEVASFITPRIEFTQLLGSTTPSWFAIATYFSTVVGCLALAIVAVNRRELSYASAG